MMTTRVLIRTTSLLKKCVLPTSSIGATSKTCNRSKATAASVAIEENIVEDFYPSRGKVTECKLLPRHDPVIWGDITEMAQKGPLSAAELHQFQDQGFLVMPGVFGKEETLETGKDIMSSIEREEEELRKQKALETEVDASGNQQFVTDEGTGKIRSVFALHRTLDSAIRLVRDRRIVDRVKQILNDDVYIHQCRFNTHAAFQAPGFAFHSDFEYWHSEDGVPKPRTVFAIVFFSNHTPQNGALMVMPGSHKKFLSVPGATPKEAWKLHQKDHKMGGVGVPPQQMIADLCNKHGLVHCTGKAGSVMLMDSMLVHGSSKNPTPWHRLSYFVGYNSIINKPVNPFEAPMTRPDILASRDPEWVKPIVAV